MPDRRREATKDSWGGKAKMLGLVQKVYPSNWNGVDWRETSRKKATGADGKR